MKYDELIPGEWYVSTHSEHQTWIIHFKCYIDRGEHIDIYFFKKFFENGVLAKVQDCNRLVKDREYTKLSDEQKAQLL